MHVQQLEVLESDVSQKPTDKLKYLVHVSYRIYTAIEA